MALNREQKRLLKKQGEVNDDGDPIRSARNSSAQREPRVGAKQFVHEIRAELRKVAWPTKEETWKYSFVVFLTLVVMTTFIFVIDAGFSELVLQLFNAK